jgi:hypothetical protein
MITHATLAPMRPEAQASGSPYKRRLGGLMLYPAEAAFVVLARPLTGRAPPGRYAWWTRDSPPCDG